MNARLARATLAISSILIASIVVGGMLVFAGGLLYRWLAEVGSPGLALSCLFAGALLLGGLIVVLGQIALRHAFLPPSKDTAPRAPDHLIAGELVRLAEGNPAKLVAVSLGVGFALGLSPRLRRTVYRTLVE